jgi:sugar/nucleoside kinase (ribokinase family)
MQLKQKTTSQSPLVVSVGSALIDILVHESDAFVAKTGAAKGGMRLVSHDIIADMLAQTKNKPQMVPGGSACNTAVGVGQLGGAARFVGKCGQDDYGRHYEAELVKAGVKAQLFKTASPTGQVLSIITPDAQRSMFTYLGASAEILPEEMTVDCFFGAKVVHIEGYLLFNKALIVAVMQAAKKAGALVSLDLAAYTVVEENKGLISQLVKEYVDILIANEDEAAAYTGFADEEKALAALAPQAEIAVLKVGPRGSYIASGNKTRYIEPVAGVKAVDTTGAGDLWAAGFLYGLVNGYGLKAAGELGSLCGAEVCRVVGAAIPAGGWQRIKTHFADL